MQTINTIILVIITWVLSAATFAAGIFEPAEIYSLYSIDLSIKGENVLLIMETDAYRNKSRHYNIAIMKASDSFSFEDQLTSRLYLVSSRLEDDERVSPTQSERKDTASIPLEFAPKYSSDTLSVINENERHIKIIAPSFLKFMIYKDGNEELHRISEVPLIYMTYFICLDSEEENIKLTAYEREQNDKGTIIQIKKVSDAFYLPDFIGVTAPLFIVTRSQIIDKNMGDAVHINGTPKSSEILDAASNNVFYRIFFPRDIDIEIKNE